MNFLIIMFGALILLVGSIVIVNPELIFNVLLKNSNKLWLHVTAVIARLLLGALLIYQADASKYPHVMEVIGWIAVVAAIILILIGRERFAQLISWAATLVKSFGRVAGLLAVGFGAFLIYAFV